MATQNLGRIVGSKIYTGSAIETNGIQTQLASQNIIPLIYDLYISTSLSALFQYQLVENAPTWAYIMSMKGETGKFEISKSYSSISAMNAGFDTDGLPEGALAVVETGNVEDEDNAKLFVKGKDQYNFLTDMSGAAGIQGPRGEKGPQGDKGAAGSVFTPSVSSGGIISWTNNGGLANPEPINIKGPQGETGPQGIQGEKGDVGPQGETGPQGIQGERGIQGVPGEQGVKGETGPQGPRGEKGEKGEAGADGAKGDPGSDGKTPTLSINSSGELIATYE